MIGLMYGNFNFQVWYNHNFKNGFRDGLGPMVDSIVPFLKGFFDHYEMKNSYDVKELDRLAPSLCSSLGFQEILLENDMICISVRERKFFFTENFQVVKDFMSDKTAEDLISIARNGWIEPPHFAAMRKAQEAALSHVRPAAIRFADHMRMMRMPFAIHVSDDAADVESDDIMVLSDLHFPRDNDGDDDSDE